MLKNELNEVAFFHQYLTEIYKALEEIKPGHSVHLSELHSDSEMLTAFEKTLEITRSTVIEDTTTKTYKIQTEKEENGFNSGFIRTFNRVVNNSELRLATFNI